MKLDSWIVDTIMSHTKSKIVDTIYIKLNKILTEHLTELFKCGELSYFDVVVKHDKLIVIDICVESEDMIITRSEITISDVYGQIVSLVKIGDNTRFSKIQ